MRYFADVGALAQALVAEATDAGPAMFPFVKGTFQRAQREVKAEVERLRAEAALARSGAAGRAGAGAGPASDGVRDPARRAGGQVTRLRSGPEVAADAAKGKKKRKAAEAAAAAAAPAAEAAATGGGGTGPGAGAVGDGWPGAASQPGKGAVQCPRCGKMGHATIRSKHCLHHIAGGAGPNSSKRSRAAGGAEAGAATT